MTTTKSKSKKDIKATVKTAKKVSIAKQIQLLSDEINKKATERMFKDLILGK